MDSCFAALDAPSVLLDATDDVQHLQYQLTALDNWQLRKQVIAAENGCVTYYQASNLAEIGLVEPAALQTLGPTSKLCRRAPSK